MNERRGQKLLEAWMTTALTTGESALRSLPASPGLTLPWSSGAVEGYVNFKMLKRQTYGRASSDLLRRRVLLAD
jgi:transposase